MNKLLSLSLLCLGLVGGARAQTTCSTTITNYPYSENFDGATAPGWTSGGTNSSWVLGKPAKTIINSAASGTKSWVTSLAGTYNASEQSYVESPCFNLSSLTQPVIEMRIWWNSEFSTDGAVLQSSIDGGTTWQKVGAKGDPNNWYNDNTINGAPGGQPAATAEGWSGRNLSGNGSGGWVLARHVLTGLGGQANVKLRIAFGADGALQEEGFAFDNFAVYESPANDAGIVAIATPATAVTPGVSQPVQVTLKNFGTAALTSATIGWSVNGVAQANFPWTGSLATQASAPVSIGNYTFPVGNFTLKAWSKNPNAAPDAFAGNDTTTLNINACAPLAGSYTINKNNPTAGTNFQSITEAAQRLNLCGVSAPVTLTVTSGTGPYSEQVEILSIPNTSATNTVTFEGSGNTVSATPVGKPGIFVLNGAKYVKLNNFVITLPATVAFGWGVQLISAAEFNTISNNTINLPIASVSVNLTGIGIGASSGSAGNNASNTGIRNNVINGGNYGIRIVGNTGGLNADNNQIVDNQVRDPYLYGIHVSNANGTLIERNDISRPTRMNGTTFYNMYLTGLCLNTIISKNRMHNPSDMTSANIATVYGIYTAAVATTGNENIIRNNAIYNLNNASGSFYAFYNLYASGTYYYNNTIASDTAITYGTLRGLYLFGPATNVKFKNNVISLPSVAANSKYAIYVGGTGVALESNNNDLYVGSTGNVGYYLTAKATLADWKAANGNAYDQNSVSADPLFVSAATGNLAPSNATLDNLGQPLAAVTDDILGAVRPATPDLGAFEFGIAANDVGITAVSGPSITGCGLSATETITVTIKNYGVSPQASVPVSFSVNGVPMAATPETYNAAPLAPNATATYTFTAKANLAPSGTYVIAATTKLAGDLALNNDTDTLTITNSLLPGLPSAFDFETPASGISRFRKVIKQYSNNMESAAASNGTASTKGMIMDGIDNAGWVTPVGVTDPWTSNPDNFSGVYTCIIPNGGAASDSLLLTFDLKQLFKGASPSTNFRVTVNGAQVGTTYRPPFNGVGGTTNWTRVKIDLSAYLTQSSIQIGLESSVKEAYANGTGTANLIDNINILRVAGPTGPTGVKENALQAKVIVYPNPSNGIFHIDLPKGKTCDLTVTDLTGKVLKKQAANGNSQLNLEGAAKGIYLLKVTSENGSAVRKLIVE